MNVLEEAEKFYPMKKAANGERGEEWHGACPKCGDSGKGANSNKFHVWPDQNGGQGSWWCRSCNKGGDLIQFYLDFCGKTFPEAAALAGKEITQEDGYRLPKMPVPGNKTGENFEPVESADLDRRVEQWKVKAAKFVGWANTQLLKNSEMMAWLTARGLTRESVIEFKLGYNPGENDKDIWRPRESWGLSTFIKPDGKKKRLWVPRGIVIPYMLDCVDVLRVRIRRFEAEGPKYYVIPGGSSIIMVLGTERRAYVIVESELDAILVYQECRHLGVGVIAVGSSHVKPDKETDRQLQKSLIILNALDADGAGASAQQFWKERYSRVERWPVPEGKDPGEAFALGVNIAAWIRAGLPPALTIASSRLAAIKQKNAERAENIAVDSVPKVKPIPSPQTVAASDAHSCAIPESVQKLHGLLKKYPVKIRNTKNRTMLLQDEKWAHRNWSISCQISSLVFYDPECMDFLHRHPSNVIGGHNYYQEVSQ